MTQRFDTGTPQDAFNKFQTVSPEMLNYGFNVGQDLISKQREKWMPGVSGFWNSLKIYFAVSNTFVIKKILTVLYPYSNKNYFRVPADEVGMSQRHADAVSHKWALPREDMNAPDLYVPVMSFITYILLSGLFRGIDGSTFTPDVLIQAIWRCLILQFCEVMLMKVGLSLMQVTIPILDLFAYTGYKYIGLCVITFARLLGVAISVLCTLYCAFMLASYFVGCLRCLVPANTTVGPPRHIMLLGFAAMQFFVVFILGCWF